MCIRDSHRTAGLHAKRRGLLNPHDSPVTVMFFHLGYRGLDLVAHHGILDEKGHILPFADALSVHSHICNFHMKMIILLQHIRLLSLRAGPTNIGPVSYTHLDVYKRQAEDISFRADGRMSLFGLIYMIPLHYLYRDKFPILFTVTLSLIHI